MAKKNAATANPTLAEKSAAQSTAYRERVLANRDMRLAEAAAKKARPIQS